MNVEIISSDVSDNFFCLFADDDGIAAVIDPVDGDKAVDEIRRRGWELEYLLNTHFHHDHVDGNQTVIDAFPEALVVCGEADAERIQSKFDGPDQRGVDATVRGGETVDVGQIELQVLDTPGHTPGHISFLYEHHLFSGDTIFVGGAGNCKFGGDPGQLFETFRDVLRPLPPETVFYPGHDYATRNAEFLLSIEPEHPETESVLQEARRAADEGRLMKTTLGRERAYNAFMRFDDPELHNALEKRFGDEFDAAKSESASNNEAAFRCVRRLRNHW